MTGCCAVGCTNRDSKGFLMKRFPRDPERRKHWEVKVSRANWKPTSSSYLCEEKKEAIKNAPIPTPHKKPKEKELKINIETEKSKEVSKPKEKEIKINVEKEKPNEVNTPKVTPKEIEVIVDKSKDVPSRKPESIKVKGHVTKKVEFNTKPEERIMEPIPPPAPAPPPPPMAPPPPPPPQAKIPSKPLTKEKETKLEALRSRPRKRPDWTDMMKEVEQGIKLNHVKCNDRSAPVLPQTKTKGQFVYDSEKPNSHNQLLKEIHSGIHLKKTKTNDRSRPNLEGLRKFRRQMTIEEIITKSASVADVVAVASQPDELDDIDKVRDDLQSTKQMLALELRNKEALERENKRILARLANLEAELEKEKQGKTVQEQGLSAKLTRTDEDNKLISRLKEEAAESAGMTKEMEDKYHKTAEELDLTRAKLESAWLKNSQLEMELKSKGKYHPPLTKQVSTKKIPNSISDKKIQSSVAVNKEPEDSDTVTESESEGEDEDEEDEVINGTSTATQEERELKLLNNKLKTIKEKKTVASNEKKSLKSQLSKLQHVLKEEKKKYKLLQKEVEKMASLMKDVEGDEDEEEEEEEDVEEEDDEETESESESEEEVNEEEIQDDASHHEKVRNFNARIRTFETLLTRAKKGNYLLKANIERKQDDVNRQKEMSLALQEDLNAVLSELG